MACLLNGENYSEKMLTCFGGLRELSFWHALNTIVLFTFENRPITLYNLNRKRPHYLARTTNFISFPCFKK